MTTEFGKKTSKKKIAGIVILAITGILAVLIATGLSLDSTPTPTIKPKPVPPNTEPTANAGPDQTVNEGTTVQLDGSGSTDPDGTIASYSWTPTNGPSVTLSDASSATPSFTAPDVEADGETLTFELTATDNDGSTSTTADTVAVNVDNVVVNLPPTANAGPDQTVNAGPDQTVNEGTTVQLDGSGSTDPDGDTLTHSWVQIGGPSVTLSDNTSPTPQFTVPGVGEAEATLRFELAADDGNGHRVTDTVDVRVVPSTDPIPFIFIVIAIAIAAAIAIVVVIILIRKRRGEQTDFVSGDVDDEGTRNYDDPKFNE